MLYAKGVKFINVLALMLVLTKHKYGPLTDYKQKPAHLGNVLLQLGQKVITSEC